MGFSVIVCTCYLATSVCCSVTVGAPVTLPVLHESHVVKCDPHKGEEGKSQPATPSVGCTLRSERKRAKTMKLTSLPHIDFFKVKNYMCHGLIAINNLFSSERQTPRRLLPRLRKRDCRWLSVQQAGLPGYSGAEDCAGMKDRLFA